MAVPRLAQAFITALLALGCGLDVAALAGEATPFERKIKDRVAPYLAAGETGTIEGEGGVKLATFRAPAQGDVVVLLEGYSESYRLYGEVMLELSDFGYDVATFDFRGQGLSERLTEPADIGYVDSVDDYVKDLQRFVDSLTPTLGGRRLLLVAHSTGGLVAAHYVAVHPEVFSRVVLSAPYFRLNTGWLPEWFVLLTTRAMGWIGRGASFAPGQGNWTVEGATFEDNRLTHSRERFDAWIGALRAEPALVIRGASNAWTAATVTATRQLPDLVDKITPPVLLLQAGEDVFVLNEGHDELCLAMPRCEIVRYPTAYHELFQEVDEVRGDVMLRLAEFLGRREPR